MSICVEPSIIAFARHCWPLGLFIDEAGKIGKQGAETIQKTFTYNIYSFRTELYS